MLCVTIVEEIESNRMKNWHIILDLSIKKNKQKKIVKLDGVLYTQNIQNTAYQSLHLYRACVMGLDS